VLLQLTPLNNDNLQFFKNNETMLFYAYLHKLWTEGDDGHSAIHHEASALSALGEYMRLDTASMWAQAICINGLAIVGSLIRNCR